MAGVDENTIIEILVKRSNEQRQQIKEAYQQTSGKVMTMAHRWDCPPQHPLPDCYTWFLSAASGICSKKCSERRSGGSGAGSAENTSSV